MRKHLKFYNFGPLIFCCFANILCIPHETQKAYDSKTQKISDFQKRLYMQKLLDPPKPTKAQRSKTFAARLCFGSSAGIALGYISAKLLQTIFNSLEDDMKTEADFLRLGAECSELKKMSDCFAAQVKNFEKNTQPKQTALNEPYNASIQDSLRKQKIEEQELKLSRANFEILFLMIITVPLCYKLSKKIFKDPSWTYQQILSSFIKQWPKVKPEIPEQFWTRCQELYEIYFEHKSALEISEEQAEVIVKQFAFDLMPGRA